LTKPAVPVENVAEMVWGALLIIYLVGAGLLTVPVVLVFGVSSGAALLELWLRRRGWRLIALYDSLVWTVLLSAMVAVTGGRASQVWPAYVLMSLTAPSLGHPLRHYGLLAVNSALYLLICIFVGPAVEPVSPTLLMLRVGLFFLVAYVVDRSMGRERAALQQAVAAGRDRAAELVRARDAERRRVAADLHDWLGAGLVAPMRRLELAGRTGSDEAVRRGIGEAVEALQRGHEEARRIMEALHPHLLEQLGLTGALNAYVRQWSDQHGVGALFVAGGDGPEPPAEIALAAYRIVQEALNNVARHAGAGQADVRATLLPDSVVVTVRDDGRGLAAGAPAGAGGRGLVGMAERAAMWSGSVKVTSAPGRGTTVEAVLPYTCPRSS